MTHLELAKARANLTVQLSGGASSRVAARVLSANQCQQLNDPALAAMVLYSSDPVTRDQAKLMAASILNANDIAASVSSEDRLAIAQLIDAETRVMALSSRNLARPATGLKGTDCVENIRANLPEMGVVFAEISPFEDTPAELPNDIERLRPVAIAALERVSLPVG